MTTTTAQQHTTRTAVRRFDAPAKRAAKKKPSTSVAVHKPQQPKSFLEVIKDAALDPKVDVSKMQALLDMQLQIERRQSELAFNNALADAKDQIPVVVKDKKGDRGITYASLEKVSRSLDPVLKDHGFTITYGMADNPDPEKFRITATLRHRGGHSAEFFADIPFSITGPKGAPIMSKTQGAGAAISFGRRYLKLMMFDITIANEDVDGAAVQTVGSDELLKLNQLIKNTQTNVEDFCAHYGIEAVPDLPLSKYKAAVNLLEQKERQQAKS